MTQPNPSVDLVFAAMDGILVEHSEAAVERDFHPDFVQHNPFAKDGSAHVKEMCAFEFGLESRRWAAQGDLVAYHGIYTAPNPLGDLPLHCVDLWRVAGGQIVEHWDALSPIPADAVEGWIGGEGNGAKEVDAARVTAQAARARAFFESGERASMVHGDLTLHIPGAEASPETLEREVPRMDVRATVASGDLVFVHGACELAGAPMAAFFVLRFDDAAAVTDIWRVAQPITPQAEAANPHPHF